MYILCLSNALRTLFSQVPPGTAITYKIQKQRWAQSQQSSFQRFIHAPAHY